MSLLRLRAVTDEAERKHVDVSPRTESRHSVQQLGALVELPNWIESEADRAAFIDSLSGIALPQLPDWLEDPTGTGPRISLIKPRSKPAVTKKSATRLAKAAASSQQTTQPVLAAAAPPIGIPDSRTPTWSTAAPRRAEGEAGNELSRVEQLRRQRPVNATGVESVLARGTVALVALLLLILPAFIAIGPREYLPTGDVVRAFSAIDRIAAGTQVLAIFENPAGHISDLDAAERVILDHLTARQAHIIAASTGEASDLGRLGIAQPDGIARIATANDVDTIRRLGARSGTGKQAVPTDANLRLATGGLPVDLVIVFAGDAIDASRWLGNFRQGGVPAGIAVVAGGDAKLLSPIRGSGQVLGIINVPGDLPAYLSLAGSGPYPSKAGSASNSTGPALASLLLLAGLAAGFRKVIAIRFGTRS